MEGKARSDFNEAVRCQHCRDYVSRVFILRRHSNEDSLPLLREDIRDRDPLLNQREHG